MEMANQVSLQVFVACAVFYSTEIILITPEHPGKMLLTASNFKGSNVLYVKVRS